MRKTKHIFIATGIYPPQIGGPAEYAKQLKETWEQEGYKVSVRFFDFEHKLPPLVRHVYFMVRSVSVFLRADFVLVLDTFSVALPIAILSLVFRKSFVLRTGGDFLWESYTERTREKILLRDFYKQKRPFTLKERFIFRATRFVLRRASRIIFSTMWQRDIWAPVYKFDLGKGVIVENFYGKDKERTLFTNKTFVGAVRPLVWKNTDTLEKVFGDFDIKERGYLLDIAPTHNKEFLLRMRECFAVILISLGDISPNMILDCIRLGKPFIVTTETGIKERIKDIALFVNPLDLEDIKAKVLWLADEENYNIQKAKVEAFAFHHSWQEIAEEILYKYE